MTFIDTILNHFRKNINTEKYAKHLFAKLSQKNKLEGWKCEFNNLISCGAYTEYTRKVISFSRILIENPKTDYKILTNIILHEIAHALDGPDNSHHGPEWVCIAKNIGYNFKNGIYCYNFTTSKDYKYKLVCNNNCRMYKCYKTKKRRYYCDKHNKKMKVILNDKYKKRKSQ
jgi:hypothetical protein